MDARSSQEPSKEDRRVLTPTDIERLFPIKVIKSSTHYVETVPRDGVNFERVYSPAINLEGLTGAEVWRFSEIGLRLNEAAHLDLPPFAMGIDYFGGPRDLAMLFDLLKVIGKSKDEKSDLPFRLFFQRVLVGVLGADPHSTYDKDTDKILPTEQMTLFEKTLLESQKPPLILYGHGGFAYTKQGYAEKTIGTRKASEACSLNDYLLERDLEKYSAILDMSCTVNSKFSTETLPKLLPRNCPPFFGSSELVDRAMGLIANDSYIINNHKVTVFPKKTN